MHLSCPQEFYLSKFIFFQPCPVYSPPRIGYEYDIDVHCETNFTDYIRPGLELCEKFANDHPEYSWYGSVERSTLTKGCYLNKREKQAVYNGHSTGADPHVVRSFPLYFYPTSYNQPFFEQRSFQKTKICFTPHCKIAAPLQKTKILF